MENHSGQRSTLQDDKIERENSFFRPGVYNNYLRCQGLLYKNKSSVLKLCVLYATVKTLTADRDRLLLEDNSLYRRTFRRVCELVTSS